MGSAHILTRGKDPSGKWVTRGLTARTGRPQAGRSEPLTDVRYVVRYRVGGRGSKPLTGGTFSTMREAKARRDAIRLRLAAGEDPREPIKAVGTPLLQALEQTLEERRVGLAPETVRNWRNGIANLGELGSIFIEEMRWQDLQAWHLANLHLAPSTRAQYFGQYRSALGRFDIEPNPADSRNLRWAKKARGPAASEIHEDGAAGSVCPTHAEVEAMLEHLRNRPGRTLPSPHLKPVMFMALTGVRFCELKGIRRADVDVARGRIWIPRTKGGTAGHRFIPITRELAPLIPLLDLSPSRGQRLLFPHPRTGGPLTHNSIYKAMMRASKAAGLPSTIGPHDLRHRFLSRLLAANVPDAMVRDIAGHSNLTSLHRVYAHVLPNEPVAPLVILREDVIRFFDEGRDRRTT
ncbi:MAG: tyrosine-type recombinase/integrase [Thermoleophilia bacterium]